MSVKQHFDTISQKWYERYNRNDRIQDYELFRRRDLAIGFLRQSISTTEAKILEVGCGAGNVIGELVAQTGWQGIGLDISDKMIDLCRTHYGDNERLSFFVHDLDSGAADYTVDAVLALGVVGYLKNPQHVFQHVHSMLKPGGYFIFTVNKPSLPRSLTLLYRGLRRNKSGAGERALPMTDLRQYMDGYFTVLETYDYAYMPYVPVLRQMVFLSRLMERILGRRPTWLSSTTLLITHKL